MNGTEQDALYQTVAETHGAALDRLARAYELDSEARRDLLQEIHLQLWRSLAGFDGRCSLRTWVYRVAHNVATAYVIRQRRIRNGLVSIEDLDTLPSPHQDDALLRLSTLIQKLKPLDRQVIVSYLEGLDAGSTGEITGLSAANVAMKVHRIKKLLKRWFGEGGSHAE